MHGCPTKKDSPAHLCLLRCERGGQAQHGMHEQVLSDGECGQQGIILWQESNLPEGAQEGRAGRQLRDKAAACLPCSTCVAGPLASNFVQPLHGSATPTSAASKEAQGMEVVGRPSLQTRVPLTLRLAALPPAARGAPSRSTQPSVWAPGLRYSVEPLSMASSVVLPQPALRIRRPARGARDTVRLRGRGWPGAPRGRARRQAAQALPWTHPRGQGSPLAPLCGLCHSLPAAQASALRLHTLLCQGHRRTRFGAAQGWRM